MPRFPGSFSVSEQPEKAEANDISYPRERAGGQRYTEPVHAVRRSTISFPRPAQVWARAHDRGARMPPLQRWCVCAPVLFAIFFQRGYCKLTRTSGILRGPDRWTERGRPAWSVLVSFGDHWCAWHPRTAGYGGLDDAGVVGEVMAALRRMFGTAAVSAAPHKLDERTRSTRVLMFMGETKCNLGAFIRIRAEH